MSVNVESPKTFNVTPNRAPVSLKAVMDEELAHKLQSEQSPVQVQIYEENLSKEEDIDEDLRLALELSAKEAQERESLNVNSNSSPVSAPSTAESVNSSTSLQSTSPAAAQLDEDFLFALNLQNQIDDEQYARHIQEKYRASADPDKYSKVSTSFDTSFNGRPYNGHPFYRDNEAEEDDDDDGLDFEGSLESNLLRVKQHHQVAKPGGREVITKHNAALSAAKNASTIEKFMDSGDMRNIDLETPVFNSLRESSRHQETSRNKVRGNRLDTATSEHVMDPRTRVILLKLLNNETLAEMHGTISAGKESNVYHAFAGFKEPEEGEQAIVAPGTELAVKIFKTTLNEFKNRGDYIEGEFRFKNKTSKHNPRKLIKVWAEKEMRNLKRLQSAHIPSPTPVSLKENILIMTFIGKGGFPAPCLKDVDLPASRLSSVYVQSIKLMRRMYQDCKLVHADLSEYNMLYHDKKVWIIDVSQSVEIVHPKSMDFLRKDCLTVTTFFSKRGVQNTLSARQLFDFITNPHLTSTESSGETLDKAALQLKREELMDKNIEKTMNAIAENPERTEEEAALDRVFLNDKNFVPRTLHEVRSHELYGNDTFHHAVTGLLTGEEESEDEDDEEDDDDEDEMDNEEIVEAEQTK